MIKICSCPWSCVNLQGLHAWSSKHLPVWPQLVPVVHYLPTLGDKKLTHKNRVLGAGPSDDAHTELLLRNARAQRWSVGWVTFLIRKGWDSWGCTAERRAPRRSYSTFQEGLCKKPLCIWADSDRTRGNGFKLKEGKLRLVARKKFFTQRVLKY